MSSERLTDGPRLHFVIPLRARRVSTDFDKVSAQLNATLRSARRAVDPLHGRVLVVGHDHPEIDLSNLHAEFMQVDFDPPRRLPKDSTDRDALTELRVDKGRKLLAGLASLQPWPQDYFMCLDADDLVSSRVLDCLLRQRPAHGFYFENGFMFNLNHPGRIFLRRQFYKECGSSFVLRVGSAPFPEKLDLSRGFSDYFIRRYEVHAYIPEAMARAGKPLVALPFPGAIYVVGGQNIYANTFRRQYGRTLSWLRGLIMGNRLIPSMVEEFSLLPYLKHEGELSLRETNTLGKI